MRLALYAGGLCLMYQHNIIEEIEQILNEDVQNLCDWFVDNKLSIHLGDDKTKTFSFPIKRAAKCNCQQYIYINYIYTYSSKHK